MGRSNGQWALDVTVDWDGKLGLKVGKVYEDGGGAFLSTLQGFIHC